MSDIYNSKIAKLIKWLSRVPKDRIFGITTSSETTRYDCFEEQVTDRLRKHEDTHKADIADWQQRKGKYWGWVSWMTTYLWRMLTVGYDNEFEETANRGLK